MRAWIMSALFAISLLGPTLGACGGDEGPGGGGAGGGTGGSGTGGGDPCAMETGAKVTKPIGPEGGTLELCGARLEVASGALAETVELGIERIAPPGDAPFETEYTGGVFRFTPEDRDFVPGVDVFLPHGGAEGRIYLLTRIADEWAQLEACSVDEHHIQQTVERLGVYTAVRDVITWPDSTDGLGDGTLAYTWMGAMQDRTLDDGYAIYDEGQDGARGYTLVFRSMIGDHLENWDIRLAVPAQGAADLLQVSFIDTGDVNGGWTYVTAIHTGGTVTLAPDPSSNGRLKGTIDTLLYQGETSSPFHATFDVLAERYRFPPELACSLPEG